MLAWARTYGRRERKEGSTASLSAAVDVAWFACFAGFIGFDGTKFTSELVGFAEMEDVNQFPWPIRMVL